MEEYWDRFVASGKIEDYLYYKGMSICEETINRYKEGDTIGKSDYTDCGNTDQRKRENLGIRTWCKKTEQCTDGSDEPFFIWRVYCI